MVKFLQTVCLDFAKITKEANNPTSCVCKEGGVGEQVVNVSAHLLPKK